MHVQGRMYIISFTMRIIVKITLLAELFVLHQLLVDGLQPVMLSRRGQSGLEAKILASASKIWPQPRPRSFGLGLDLVVLLCNWAFFGQSVILKDAGTTEETDGTVIRSKWTVVYCLTTFRWAIMGPLLSVIDDGRSRHAAYGHATCLPERVS